MTFDWSPFLVGGGTRPDAMSGLNPALNSALAQLFTAAPENIRNNMRITSGFRSNEVQEKLWADALAKYGDPEIADNWVARPGQSNHNHGGATDFKFLDPSAQEWVHQNASQFELQFPMKHEPWHVELGGDPKLSFSAGPAPSKFSTMFNPEVSALDMGSPVAGMSDLFTAQRLQRQQAQDREEETEQKRRVALADTIRY